MRQSRTRRISPGFGYIGSGNKTSIFTRRAKPPFSKVKAIYGEELERLKLEKVDQKLSFKELTKEEKLRIRSRIKAELLSERKKQIVAFTILVLFVLAIFITLKHLFLTK